MSEETIDYLVPIIQFFLSFLVFLSTFFVGYAFGKMRIKALLEEKESNLTNQDKVN